MKPYTYLIKHKPTGQVYYGVRTANKLDPINDLWQEYFTSSKKIHALIEETGKDSFDVEIRREFDTVEEAVAWEIRVLQRCRVLEDSRWLNANIAGHIPATEEVRAKISAFHKDKPKTNEHRDKIAAAITGIKREPRDSDYRKKMSEIKSGSGNAMFGKKHSAETLAKMRAKRKEQGSPWNLGSTISEEQKQKQREKMLGRKQDPNVVAQRAATAKSRGHKRERKICEHCNKDVAVNIYARYHGDCCKSRK